MKGSNTFLPPPKSDDFPALHRDTADHRLYIYVCVCVSLSRSHQLRALFISPSVGVCVLIAVS